MDQSNLIPSTIELHQRSNILELHYGTERYALSCEFLRVQSPSAEVKGHGPGQEVLQVGKINVGIDALVAVGNYALQPTFSDGHDTGIFSWSYLQELCLNQDTLWQNYLDRISAAGASRDPEVQVVRIGN
ncbi:MAG: DUF971 family protein [Paraglaciecola psychrophila]|jgi:DUF971 family protein